MSPHDDWRPWEPSERDPWNSKKVAHLHRRAGFGASWSELRRDLEEGPEASVARFLSPRPESARETAVSDALRSNVGKRLDYLSAWWLHRILWGNDPLREKMTLFWHDHFATSHRKVGDVASMGAQNDLFRRHALGRFGELLRDVTGDPAMLLWLDGGQSRAEAPNENYAREFLELFTLGAGHYTEQDIRAAARAFVGWRPWPRGAEYTFRFDRDLRDAGEKVFLSRVGAWDASGVVEVTLEHPEAARFLCRKLDRFFVSELDPPTDDVIDGLAEELRDHEYSIAHVVGVILRSRRFYSERAHRRRVRSPVEWSAGMLRHLDVPRADVRLLSMVETCARQGQELFRPPSVKGWEWGSAWLGSAAMIERANWMSWVVFGSERHGLRPFDHAEFAARNDLDPREVVPALIDLTLQDDVPAASRRLIMERDTAHALHVMLSTPEAHLA